jgi:hypothetical protein
MKTGDARPRLVHQMLLPDRLRWAIGLEVVTTNILSRHGVRSRSDVLKIFIDGRQWEIRRFGIKRIKEVRRWLLEDIA